MKLRNHELVLDVQHPTLLIRRLCSSKYSASRLFRMISCLQIALPSGTTIWLAAGVTDMRRGFTGLSGAVQTVLNENPFGGHVFVFRGNAVTWSRCSGGMATISATLERKPTTLPLSRGSFVIVAPLAWP